LQRVRRHWSADRAPQIVTVEIRPADPIRSAFCCLPCIPQWSQCQMFACCSTYVYIITFKRLFQKLHALITWHRPNIYSVKLDAKSQVWIDPDSARGLGNVRSTYLTCHFVKTIPIPLATILYIAAAKSVMINSICSLIQVLSVIVIN